jgi:hypothetical protein
MNFSRTRRSAAAPLLNHADPAGGGTLPQAGQITLSTTVRNIQGCDFVTGTELICSANDAAKDVLRVTLPHPLNGQATVGQVTTDVLAYHRTA